MHFVQGVDSNPIKLQFLKSIQCIAESCGTHVIAEGVETEAELRTIKDIGIALGQGYFIGRPSPTPPLIAPPEISRIIHAGRIAVSAKPMFTSRGQVTALKLLTYIEPVQPDTVNGRIFERFSENQALRVISVVRNGAPVGLINRYNFIDRFSRPYQRELFGRKPCADAMQAMPLMVSKDMPLERSSAIILSMRTGSNFPMASSSPNRDAISAGRPARICCVN